MKQYDAIIIGFGEGGKRLATELASRNWKVAIVESPSRIYRGAYANVGYTSAKALIYESEYAERQYHDDYKNQSKFYALAIARKNKLMHFLHEKDYEKAKVNANITIYDGTASFLSENTIHVISKKGKTILKGKEIFINTGSAPAIPDIEGLTGNKRVYTCESLLHEDRLPKRLLIIGSGTVGLELATIYSGFGSEVSILERSKQFMPEYDRDIATSMAEALKRKGVSIHLNIHTQAIHDTADGITLTYTHGSGDNLCHLEGDALLLATGHRPMIDGLNPEKAGVETNECGAITVNEYLQTTAPHIWALGEVKGGRLYNHLSIDDFHIIRNRLFGDKSRSTHDRNPIAHVVFTDPPLAHVGLTEEEAARCGYSIRVSRLPASSVLRTRTLQNIDGMLKAVINAHTGQIIGCTLLCADAPEIINTVVLAMKTGQRYNVLRDFIFTRPSMNEGLNDLFKSF
ncbi:NAD(P)/FAD-dependent oxidoreductase [Bacteroides helcogenes]|uniref:FAD-dependent pyridine nucleotide-disulfide oxidoreductase n=1 Tax=Bacteroides helcogenes (strain ATCC 35417 / DSM 20613 / JCM 6297 / CCUG 15421 / P 36-108) TaxID=693979 RepID=E6SSF7_BACT6|nr:NAD(P)/FAD-dependent oxidoreductase [Bacteroides helcogenes]ADV45208.1 FAD-dependent pyridine nucleotide-disulfide oxidoreductase [Bacteroides helcogenes P 36-108]MDY5238769.1 NAD(P)/FAD-dependent oxidoreductase [Bacteroides helcogenes]